MMAAVASFATNSASVTPPGSSSCNVPSGVIAGDLLILAVDLYAGFNGGGVSLTCSTPAGWTALTSINTTNSSGSTLNTLLTSYFYKIASGSEPTSYSFSITSNHTSTVSVDAIMARVTNWDSTYTFTEFATNNTSSSSASPTSNTINTSTIALAKTNNLSLAFATANNTSGFTMSASGVTFTSLVSAGATEQTTLFSGQFPTGSTFPAATATPVSGNSFQMGNLLVIAIPTLVNTPAFFGSTFSFLQPTIISIIQAFLSAVFGVFAPASSGEVANLWSAAVKTVGNWTSTNKTP